VLVWFVWCDGQVGPVWASGWPNHDKPPGLAKPEFCMPVISQTAKQPNSQTTKQPNNQTAKQPNNQTTKQPNNQTTKQPNNQTTKQPNR
jgi:hypothetical protein